MKEMEEDIDKVFAFSKDSVNDIMTGYEIEPLNSYSPTIKNQIVGTTMGFLHHLMSCVKTKEGNNKQD
jgi:hypothetical protein